MISILPNILSVFRQFQHILTFDSGLNLIWDWTGIRLSGCVHSRLAWLSLGTRLAWLSLSTSLAQGLAWLSWAWVRGWPGYELGLTEPGYEVGPLNYIYTWKANCQSKSEAKNGGHGAFLDVSFRPLCGHHRCQSQMVSRILIGRWPRRGLKLTSRRPPCRPCLASRFRPMINGSWPSRYIYI